MPCGWRSGEPTREGVPLRLLAALQSDRGEMGEVGRDESLAASPARPKERPMAGIMSDDDGALVL
jgi:hypothetical protein